MNPRHLFLFVVFLVLVTMVAGCGNGGGSSDADCAGAVMQAGQEYEVSAGDRVSSCEEDTRITVRHVFDGDRKYVTLLAGSARLLAGDAR